MTFSPVSCLFVGIKNGDVGSVVDGFEGVYACMVGMDLVSGMWKVRLLGGICGRVRLCWCNHNTCSRRKRVG